MKTQIYTVPALLLGLLGGTASGQATNMLQQQQQEMAAMEQEKADYADAEQKRFAQFVRERDSAISKMDREFTQYLSQTWTQFDAVDGAVRPASPKPPVMPGFDPNVSSTVQQISADVAVPAATPLVLPVAKKSEPAEFDKTVAKFIFFGNAMHIEADKRFTSIPLPKISEKEIADAFTYLSKTNYNHTLDQIQNLATNSNLNDWGYYLLCEKASYELAPDETEAVLFQWFLLLKSGFQTKLAYKNNRLFVLVASLQEVYDVPFLRIGGEAYYSFSSSLPADVKSFSQDFPLAMRPIDLSLASPANLGGEIRDTTLSFADSKKNYTVSASYNVQAMEFYRKYPKTQMSVYLGAAADASTKESLRRSFQPFIAGKSETEATELLLSFTQHAFAYKTDEEQFGQERYFFPDELLYYPYSDCEDRTVMFSYLVRQLLGLDVIALQFEGHLAAAVHFTQPYNGDFVTYSGRKYTICDPTYVNAPIGATMPQHRGEQAKIIVINDDLQKKSLLSVFDTLKSKSGTIDSRENGLATAKDGSVFAIGHYTGQLALNNDKYLFRSMKNPHGNYSQDIFIARYSDKSELVWAKTIGGPGIDRGTNVQVGTDGSVLFAGYFGNGIKIGTNVFVPANKSLGDMFIARCSADGKLMWATQLGISSPDSVAGLFSAKLSKDGKLISVSYHSDDESARSYGISEDSSAVYFNGSIFDTRDLGTKAKELAATMDYTTEEDLYDQTKNVVSEEYDPAIAGLFAAIYLAQNTGGGLPGRALLRAIEVHNPDFKTTSPEISGMLAKLKFEKNADGSLTLHTIDSAPLSLSQLQITDGAQVSLNVFESGNARIDILSGVSIGLPDLRYNLNFLRLVKSSGQLVLDYDADHTQKTLDLRNRQ